MKHDYNISQSKYSPQIQVDYWNKGWQLVGKVTEMEAAFELIRKKEIKP
jgi:hypothetical protein